MQHFKWKKILVVEDILELWKDSKQIHRKIWKYIWNKIDEILFVWVNFKQDILAWLKEWNFNWKILNNFPSYFLEDTVILFEGKKAGKWIK
jgi:UDP-N-acetylmuramyl pentapeptide synthase